MANRELGEISFDVGDKTYTMKIDANALAEMEAALSTDTRSMTWQQALTLVERGQVLAIRALLWASLRRYHRGITIEQAGDLVQQMGSSGVNKQLEAAVKAAMPTAEDREDGNPRQARRSGRGGRSSSEPGASASSSQPSGDTRSAN